jgi:hypothetical protein
MDPEATLQLLQREDDEAAVYHFQILEQLCDVLVRAADYSIIEQYPPQDFLPALCNIIKRPVHIFPETPVLCCRAIKEFLKIDQSRSCLRVVLGQSVVPSYLRGLQAVADEATQTNKDLAEECIKTLEMFSQASPSALYRAKSLLPILKFKAVCVGRFPSDVKLSAMNILASMCACVNPFGDEAELLELIGALVVELEQTKLNSGKGSNSVRECVLRSLSLLCDRGCFSVPSTASDVFTAVKGQLLPNVLPMLVRSEDTGLQSQVAILLSKLLSSSEHVLGAMMSLGMLDTLNKILDTKAAGGGPVTSLEVLALCETLMNLLFVGHRLSALRSSPLQMLLRRNLGMQVGDTIVSIHPTEGKWFSGHIAADNGDGTFAVQFDDGEYQARTDKVKKLKQSAETSGEMRLLRAIQESNIKLVNDCLSRKGRPVELLKCVDGQGTPTIVWALAVGNTEIVTRLVEHTKKMFSKTGRERILGIALRTAAAFGRPWAVQHLMDEGANPSDCSGTGASSMDSVRIGRFWAQACGACVKKGGRHDQVIDLLNGSKKKEGVKEEIEHVLEESLGNEEAELKSADIASPGNMIDSEKVLLKGKGLKPSPPPQQLDTLSFLETYILGYQKEFLGCILKSLCELCNNPACESDVRKHTIRLILSLVQFASFDMLHMLSADQAVKNRNTPGPDDSGNSGRRGSASMSSVATVLAALLEQLLSSAQRENDMLCLALRLVWTLLEKDAIFFHSEFLRRGIIEKVELIAGDGSDVSAETRSMAVAVLEFEIENGDDDASDELEGDSSEFSPRDQGKGAGEIPMSTSPARSSAILIKSPSSPGRGSGGKTTLRDGSPSLRKLMRSGSAFDRLVNVVADLQDICSSEPYSALSDERAARFQGTFHSLIEMFAENDLTAYEFEQSKVEDLLSFLLSDEGGYANALVKSLGLSGPVAEGGAAESKSSETDYKVEAFANMVSSLQTMLATSTDLASAPSPVRPKNGSGKTKIPDPFAKCMRVCLKRHPADKEKELVADLNAKVFLVEPLVAAADLQDYILGKVCINLPKYKRWCLWLVGARVQVLRENGIWATGEVVAFDSGKQQHKIVYNDGDTRSHIMAKLTYRLISFDDIDAANSLHIEPHVISSTRDGNLKEVIACIGNATESSFDHNLYDINIRNSFGNTALHIAASWERLDIMKLLILKGAKLEEVNSAGGTPLHWAARYGKSESVKVLVESGANVNALDNEGRYPADVSESNEVAEIIFSVGGVVSEKFYNGGDMVQIRESMWGKKDFPAHRWPEGSKPEDIEKLKVSAAALGESAGACTGVVCRVVPETSSGKGFLMVDFPHANISGWKAFPMEVKSVVKPYFMIGQRTLADAATWKSPLSLLDVAAERSGHVESVTLVFARPPSYTTLYVQVYECVRGKQFRLLSSTPAPVNGQVLTPNTQTIKIRPSERPKIEKGQYLAIACAKGNTLNIHSRSTSGQKMAIFYGDPPGRVGQVVVLKSYLGSDKRGTTSAGWYGMVNVMSKLLPGDEELGGGGDVCLKEDPFLDDREASSQEFTSGARVMSMWKEGSRPKYPGWYPATVVERNDDNTLKVHYDDGYKDKRVRPEYVRMAQLQDLRKREKHSPAAKKKKKSHSAGSAGNRSSVSSSSSSDLQRESASMLAAMKERVAAMKSKLEKSGLVSDRPSSRGSSSRGTAQERRSVSSGLEGLMSALGGVPPPPQSSSSALPPRPPPVASGPPRPPSPPAAMVSQLTEMGFAEDVVKRALVASGNDPNRAVEYCMDPDSMPSNPPPPMPQGGGLFGRLSGSALFGGSAGRFDIPEETASVPRAPRDRAWEQPPSRSSASSLQRELSRMFGGLMGGETSDEEGDEDGENAVEGGDLVPPQNEFIEALAPGMIVDGKDSYGKWYEATVLEVSQDEDNGKRAFIHFLGWSDKFNEWIDLSSGRVQPAHSMIEPWRDDLLEQGAMVEYRVSREKSDGSSQGGREWHIVKVIKVDKNEEKIKIRSLMPNDRGATDSVLRGEEWVSIDSERLCKQGTHIMAISTTPDKLLNDPGALASLLQNPQSLKGVLGAMTRAGGAFNAPTGGDGISSLQKQLNFLAKRIIRGESITETSETVEDPSPLHWTCFKCTFEKNLPSHERCRLCGAKSVSKKRDLLKNLAVVVRNQTSGEWMEAVIASRNDNDGSIVVSFTSSEMKDLRIESGAISDFVEVSKLAAAVDNVKDDKKGEDSEQSGRNRSSVDRHRNAEIIRVTGNGILQDNRPQNSFFSARSEATAFERSKASELFISMPTETRNAKGGKEFRTIGPFAVQVFVAEKHFYDELYGPMSSRETHISRISSCVKKQEHLYNPLALVGERVEFYWVLEEQWFKGTVQGFDGINKLHTIVYDDGEVKTYDLGKKKWRALRKVSLNDRVELWDCDSAKVREGSVFKVNGNGASFDITLDDTGEMKENINCVSMRLIQQACGVWKKGDEVQLQSTNEEFFVDEIHSAEGEAIGKGNVCLKKTESGEGSSPGINVESSKVRSPLLVQEPSGPHILHNKCSDAIQQIFMNLCSSFNSNARAVDNHVTMQSIQVDHVGELKEYSAICRYGFEGKGEGLGPLTLAGFEAMALELAEKDPAVVWSDITQIARYQYDMDPQKVAEGSEEDKAEEIVGLDLCESSKISPSKSLLAAIKEWHSSACVPNMGETGGTKVYSIFYKLAKIPDLFSDPDSKSLYGEVEGGQNRKPGAALPSSHKLALLKSLRGLAAESTYVLENENYWINKSLTRRLLNNVNDTMCMVSDTLQANLGALLSAGYDSGAFLFPYDLRRYYFQATAFGIRRALYYVQQDDKKKQFGGASPSPSKLSSSRIKFRLSKLCRELVTLSRSSVLEHSQLFFSQHAHRKGALEVRFLGEKGTGSGVTREFYSTLSSAFQHRADSQCGVRVDPSIFSVLQPCPFVVSSGYGEINPSGNISSQVAGFPSFATRGVILRSGKWYYEVEVTKAGLAQIGWASSDYEGGNSDNGDGVGDDKDSWAFDGSRVLKWNAGAQASFGEAWKVGDVVGCALNFDSREISFSLNGSFEKPMGVAFKFDETVEGMYPAVTINASFSGKVCIGGGRHGATKYDGPPGFVPVFAFVNTSTAGEAGGSEVPEKTVGKTHPMWVDDTRQQGDYVMNSIGLFPAPLPTVEKAVVDATVGRFQCLGQFVARALMEGQILPLPLSIEFFSLVLGTKLPLQLLGKIFADMPTRGSLVLKLSEFSSRSAAERGSDAGKKEFSELTGGDELYMEDMVTGCPLFQGGENVQVTIENVGLYVEHMHKFLLEDGVQVQVEAFRKGLTDVSEPLLQKLTMFKPAEIRHLICGDDRIEWTEEELFESLNAEHGYRRDCVELKNLVSVLTSFSQDERKAFLSFLTGCPHLPNGGIKYLEPPVCVMRKNPDDEVACVDEALTSSRTCRNQLHLPPYSTVGVMRQKLKQSMEGSKGIIDLA